MLNFILGRSGYGKTEYCFNKIKELTDSGCDNILLITPEQYNFTAEKKLLKLLGSENIYKVENSSFSRLYNEINRLYGSSPLPVLSNGAKGVLMKKAIESVQDDLILFRKKVNKTSFVNSMMSIYDEMKSCNISYEKMFDVSDDIEREILSQKLKDISLIIEAYENLIRGNFLDSADNLSRLYDNLLDNDYLCGKEVFIDGFNGFVANEYKILELIVEKSNNVTVTFTTDSYGENNNFDLFSYVNKSVSILEKIALKREVNCEYVTLTENYRAQNSEIANCEKYIFSRSDVSFDEKNENITVYRAKTVYDECCYVSCSIKRNLKSGIRARDIAVITRDLNKYTNELISTFKKFEIPCFDDERQPIKNQPLIVFVKYLLRCVIYSFKSDDVLSLAKTSLTDLKDDDISKLENYIFIWNINGYKKWSTEFENSTKGFVPEISENDKKEISKINKSREYLFKVLNDFKYTVKNASVKEICTAIFNTLIRFNVNIHLKNIAENLSVSYHILLADEQERIWDMLMDILDKLVEIIGDEYIPLEEFYTYFNIMVSSEDLGVIPQGVDNVQFGQADRIRLDNPKIVYILGANEGEFPKNVTISSLFTESDRILLNDRDFKLYSFSEILNFQERYFAYMAVSAPTQKLYISYNETGDIAAPSAIVTSLRCVYPNLIEKEHKSIPKLDWIESKNYAFEYMAEHFGDNDEFSASLKKYFANDERYNAVKQLSENTDIAIKNQDTAVELFGKDMYLSASRMEDYYSCAFRYFCKFGIGARPLRAAKLDYMQTGTAIHYVLENIIADIGAESLSKMKYNEISVNVNKYLLKYLNEKISNSESFNERFKYQFLRLSKMLNSVATHLAGEFSQCEFVPKAFELSIDEDGAVKPQKINLENGGTVSLKGSVDRVDILEKFGKKYIRVVDYKSGAKEFNLSDVLYGLNLQMFVYLFTLCNDKNSDYSGVPAGVLYMHASRKIMQVNKGTENAEISKEESDYYKMKGIVLYDENHNILSSMEKDLKGKYIPVKVNKSGDVSGSFASLESLGKISKKINSLIADMGNSLHKGLINQNPINGSHHDKTCEFCDYSSVCANRRIVNYREMSKYNDEDVLKLLEEE